MGCYGVCDIKLLLSLSSIKCSVESNVLSDTSAHINAFGVLSIQRGNRVSPWSRSQEPGRQLTQAHTHWVPGTALVTRLTPSHIPRRHRPVGVNPNLQRQKLRPEKRPSLPMVTELVVVSPEFKPKSVFFFTTRYNEWPPSLIA